MSYNIKNLSEKSLGEIFFVLEEIKFKSETYNRKQRLFIRIAGLEDEEWDNKMVILNNLAKKDGIIKKSLWSYFPWYIDKYIVVHIRDHFFDFYDNVKLELYKNNKADKCKKIISHKLSFDINKSILYFSGYEISITLKNDKPNAHYILEHIFTAEDGLDQKYPYEEIAKYTFEDDYDKWRMYYRACENIKQKVLNETGVNDFLEFSSGESGWVKINDKYLK